MDQSADKAVRAPFGRRAGYGEFFAVQPPLLTGHAPGGTAHSLARHGAATLPNGNVICSDSPSARASKPSSLSDSRTPDIGVLRMSAFFVRTLPGWRSAAAAVTLERRFGWC